MALAGWRDASWLACARFGSGARVSPGRSRSQYQLAVLRQAQPVFTAAVFYDQLAAWSEKCLAGNLLLPYGYRHTDDMTWLLGLAVTFHAHG